MSGLRAALVRNFGKPQGLLGALAGAIMSVRPSNRERNLRALELLAIQPRDRVLEIGFGPGLALQRAAALAHEGFVFGLDHSALMVRSATRRNAASIASGRMELQLGAIEHGAKLPHGFDKALAVNVHMFFAQPVVALREIAQSLAPAGRLAIVQQPRNRQATNADAVAQGQRVADHLRAAGFEDVRIETLELRPVNAVCVLGRRPMSADVGCGPHGASTSAAPRGSSRDQHSHG